MSLSQEANPSEQILAGSTSCISLPGLQINYKLQLQFFAQKRRKQLPSYGRIQEGPSNAPLFKSIVTIDGQTFESPQYCQTIKEAENAAANVALMSLVQGKSFQEGPGNTKKQEQMTVAELAFQPSKDKTYTGYETSKEAGNQNDTTHPDAREEDAGSHLFNSDWICTTSPNHVPIDLEGGNATNTENSMDLLSKYPLATVPPESVEPLSSQSTPVAPLKNQHHLERTDQITLNEEAVSNEDTPSSVHSDVQYLEKTVGSAEKRRFANQVFGGPTRSPMTRSSVPYVHQSPRTRSRAQSLSISTPESLKMKRTKSGRVVVPQMDSGSKRIVYDNDGLISGVAPVDLQSPLKVRNSADGQGSHDERWEAWGTRPIPPKIRGAHAPD